MFNIKYSSSLLSLFYLLFHSSQSICNFIYIEEAPYQLEECIYTGPGFSYGYYCTQSFNGTSYDEMQVLELYFPYSDTCADGLVSYVTEEAYVINQYVCSEFDCHCDGNPDDCTISTKRAYQFNEVFIDSDTGNPGCNTSYWIEEKFAWDNICLARGDIGSIGFTCDSTYGVDRIQYEDQSCTTEKDAAGTPSPTYQENPCKIYTCDGTLSLPSWITGEEEEKDNTLFIVIGAVAAVIICCGCIAAIWCCIQRKQKKEVYFDNNANQTTGY
mmetsp:Transcript_30191/g.26653  ORF Transcript_30191/g.26653 Transcript_30191/m.26653 type:complete len:271 (+) Transcript_30191:85-897(+)